MNQGGKRSLKWSNLNKQLDRWIIQTFAAGIDIGWRIEYFDGTWLAGGAGDVYLPE